MPMMPDPPAAVLRELLAIVDIDAGPTLTVLGLMQRQLPRALAICGGNLVHARFRCADAWRVELAHCAATLNTRSVNRQALRQQGVGKALIDGFIGDSARPAYTGESDPFVDVLRIDLPGVSALLNPHNRACLLTSPDHWLVIDRLPEPFLVDCPRTPAPRPDFLRLTTPADLPDGIDATALRSLELGCGGFAGLREVLAAAPALRRLCIHDASLLDSGIFDDLALPALERLELPAAAQLSIDGWSRTHAWTAIRSLRIHGLGLAQDNFEVLQSLGRAPFLSQLRELDLALFTRKTSPDARRWAELWEDREFAVETLRLRYLDPAQWRAVWSARFPLLRTLDMAANGLRDQLRAALDGAALPLLHTLDLRGNSLSPQALRDFAHAHPFANLRRIGIALDSEVMEDYCDWNGAVVGRGPVPLSAAEIEAKWLSGTGLRVLDD